MILAAALPENSNDGYVAAAYIVFFVLLLVYVVIVAWRLARVERSVRTLKGTAHDGGQASEPRARERTLEGTPHDGGHPDGHTLAGTPSRAQAGKQASEQDREHETV